MRGGCVGGDGWEDVDVCIGEEVGDVGKGEDVGIDNEKDWNSLMRQDVGGMPQTVVGI